ncbi:MAG: sulfurtransferase TusA family protein [Deltaproteobacteria bacterium]|nr:sulfurtransferase TusA family protein [Deltaproteobacteria bacterium]
MKQDDRKAIEDKNYKLRIVITHSTQFLSFVRILVSVGTGFAILVLKMKRGARLKNKKNHVLDLRGIIAPVTFLKVTQLLRTMKPGETLEILGKDPDTRTQLSQVLHTFHYQLLDTKEEGSFYRISLMKKK